MLQPKRTKYRKQFRGRRKGAATGGNTVDFGEFGLKAMGVVRALAVITNCHRKKMIWKVGVINARSAADEAAGLKLIAGTQARASE